MENILTDLSIPIIRESPWTDMQPSSVHVSYRLLKIKVELLNLLAILPSYRMNWKGFEGDAMLEDFPVGSVVQTPYGRGHVKEIREDGMLVVEPSKWALANGCIPKFYMMKNPPPYTPKVDFDDFDPAAGVRPPNPERDEYMHGKSRDFVRRVQAARGDQVNGRDELLAYKYTFKRINTHAHTHTRMRVMPNETPGDARFVGGAGGRAAA